ncbi:Psmd10, partial [Symbiodinium sp. KB8]
YRYLSLGQQHLWLSIAVNPQKLVNASWVAGSGISGDENEHGYFALDVNAPDLRGCTPLHYAAGCGDERVVAYVLSQGADPSAEDVEGKGALQWVHLLLLFSPGGMTGHTPMYYAESTGGEKCIKLIDQFVEFQKLNSLSKESSLLRAAGGGDSLELVPKDWDREFDPVSGYYFYIHKRTGEKRWETEEEREEYEAKMAKLKEAAEKKAKEEEEMRKEVCKAGQ